MKKFLVFALAALIAVPAFAGNSIRLRDTNIGAGTTVPTELLCDPNNCDTDGDVVVWDQTGECFDCVECADNEILSFDVATDTWVCDVNGSGGGGPCTGTPPAPVDNEILTWDAANSCYTSLSCSDEQMLSWEAATSEWVCVDAGNLCNAAGCTDNAIVQWNSSTECYDCLTCAADEIIQWNGSDWACIPVGFDDPSTATCLDDTAGDALIGDDLEVVDQAFVGDELAVNTCDIDRAVGSTGNTTSATYNMHVFNSMLEGATASAQPEINTLFEAHIDSVTAMNYLGLARYYNVGGADLAMNWGMEVGALGAFAWNGTDLQLQAEIAFLLDTELDTGALADNEYGGTIVFRNGTGPAVGASNYTVSAYARHDLDWSFTDDVFIAELLGFGSDTESAATCIDDDGADALFGDRDCDETQDAAENPLDVYILEANDGTGAVASDSGLELAGSDPNDIALLQGCADGEILKWDDTATDWECAADAGGSGEANADSCTTIQAGQLDALESSFADLGSDTSGTNVRMRYRRFSNSATEYANYILHVPDSLAASGNVTVTIWTRADGSADASGLGGVWDFEYAGRDDGETYDGAYTNSAFAAETYTTLDDTTLHEISQTIAVSNFTAGDWLPIRFSRDHDEASDTFDGELDILTAEVCFPQD